MIKKIFFIFSILLLLGCSQTASKTKPTLQQDKNLEKHLEQAQQYLNDAGDGALTNAYNEYKKAEKLNGNNQQVVEGLGIVLHYLSWFDESKRYLNKAYNSNDKSQKILNHLVLVHQKLGENEKALHISMELHGLEPKNKIANFLLASSLENLEKKEKALFFYKKYLEIAPSDIFIEYKIAVIAKELENWSLALKSFDNVQKKSTDYPKELHYHLAEIYIMQKNINKAKEERQRYVALNPYSTTMSKMLTYKIKNIRK